MGWEGTLPRGERWNVHATQGSDAFRERSTRGSRGIGLDGPVETPTDARGKFSYIGCGNHAEKHLSNECDLNLTRGASVRPSLRCPRLMRHDPVRARSILIASCISHPSMQEARFHEFTSNSGFPSHPSLACTYPCLRSSSPERPLSNSDEESPPSTVYES